MSKGLGPLKKLSRILKISKKSSAQEIEKKLPASQTPIHSDFSELLRKWDSSLDVLSVDFPILEGKATVDFIAANQYGELVFIWMISHVVSERIFQLLPQYDWIKRNAGLWDHLFPQVKRGKNLQLKIWFFVDTVDPSVQSVLPYLKEVPLEILRSSRTEHKPHLTPKPKLRESSTFLPPVASFTNSKSSALPSITQEEMKDLLSNEVEDHFDDQDEVTDPFIYLSDLSQMKR